MRARRVRVASGGRAVHRRPRGGAGQAGDGRIRRGCDRARDRGQAPGRQPVPGRADRRADPPGRGRLGVRRAARSLSRAGRERDAGMSPRWATTGVFVANGAAIGLWVAHIPWVQERFELSKSTMGLVIVAMALAVVLAFPVAGQAIVRHGSERIVWVGGIACALAVNLPLLAPHPLLVALGLAVLGAASATQDVAMNSHGVKVEKDLGRRIGHGSAAAGGETPRFTLPSRGVVLLAFLCFLVMVTEGAMGDWGGLYLRQDLGAGAALAALAYSFFTAGMTAGRVVGDWVNKRIGAVALLRWGALLTGVPLAAMLLIGAPAAALAGLFLVGLGVANGVPLMFSAAGRQPDTPPGPGIAAVSSMGSLGFLAGPPLIGFVADAISLPWALSMLIAGAAVVFALARRANAHTQAEPEPLQQPLPRDPVTVS